jgi:O-methyltransferase involved in polyketide biosynthesis
LVLSIVPPDDEIDGIDLEVAARSAERAASVGEPWICRMRPSEIQEQLTRLGFSDVFHLTPDLAQTRYFSGREDSLRAPKWEHLLAATV